MALRLSIYIYIYIFVLKGTGLFFFLILYFQVPTTRMNSQFLYYVSRQRPSREETFILCLCFSGEL